MLKRILSLVLLCTLMLSLLPTIAVAEEKDQLPEPQGIDTKAATWDIDGDGTLSILAIGNSFSADALQYVWNIGSSLGISEIVLGNLYIGGCSVDTHASNATGDVAAYVYYYNDSGTWTSTKNYKISTAVKSRSWDYISMQQSPPDSGVESTYGKLNTLISKVKSLMGSSAKTKLVWHMTWTYQSDSTHPGFKNYNNNQTTMYNAIVNVIKNKIQTNGNFDRVIPCATAVQNMRSSIIGDNLTRDGYHLSYDLGRFVAGLMFVKSITGLDISKNTYVPSGVSDTNAYIAVNAVNMAYSVPLKVSKSVYTGNNPSSGYIQLVPEMTKGGFWDPTSTNYNTIDTTSDTSNEFYATARFTKEELPVGTMILVKSGWKYRPEGWVTDAMQTTREDATTDKLVVVTENWWKDYTLRAFNISKTDNTSVTSLTAADILSNFSIFVPEDIYLKDHIQIKPDMHKGAYWHPMYAPQYNTPITSLSNSSRYFCTPRFTKDQLPIGSVIIVKSGYKYLPDGWVTDTLQTGTRPPASTQYSTIVDAAWWGEYTLRGFSIAMISAEVLTGKTQEEIYENFKIYVPKSLHIHTPADSSVVTAPTCTSSGYTTYNCTMCKNSYTEEQTAALGHAYTSVVTAPTCTTAGYTTSTCSRCNETTVGENIAALGHKYVYTSTGKTSHRVECDRCSYGATEDHEYKDGLCACGTVEVLEPILAKEWKINHSLNLASDISVNLVVAKSLLDGFDLSTVYMDVELDRYNGNEQIPCQTLRISPVAQGDYYYFTVDGLTAVEMNDRIRSVLHGVKNRQPYYSAVDNYSIADYAYSQLNKAGVSDALKCLCADLLRYGAAAQKFKGYRMDNLVDSYLTAEDSCYLRDLSKVSFGNTNAVLNDLNAPVITWAGKALELNSKVALKFIFDVGTYSGSVEELELEVAYTDRSGQACKLRLSNPEAYGASGRYAFSFDGLLAAELRAVVSVQIYEGNTPLSCTLRYSADTYGNNKTGALGNLCKALFAYCDSAKAYFQ